MFSSFSEHWIAITLTIHFILWEFRTLLLGILKTANDNKKEYWTNLMTGLYFYLFQQIFVNDVCLSAFCTQVMIVNICSIWSIFSLYWLNCGLYWTFKSSWRVNWKALLLVSHHSIVFGQIPCDEECCNWTSAPQIHHSCVCVYFLTAGSSYLNWLF